MILIKNNPFDLGANYINIPEMPKWHKMQGGKAVIFHMEIERHSEFPLWANLREA